MEKHIEDEKIPKMRNSQKGKRHSTKEKKHTKERGGSHIGKEYINNSTCSTSMFVLSELQKAYNLAQAPF